MKKVKYYFLLAAMVLATAIPASAQSHKETILINDFGDGRQEYETIEVREEQNVGIEPYSTASGSTLNITNPNKPDEKGPVVKAYEIKTPTAYTNISAKSFVKASVKVSDDNAGFSNCQITYVNKQGRTFSLFAYSSDGKNGVYEAHQVATVGSDGTYTFSYAYFYDNAGNTTKINKSDSKCPSSLKKSTFKIKTAKTDKVVKVKSPKAGKTSVKLSASKMYENVPISMDVTSNKGNIAYIELSLICKKGSNTKIISTVLNEVSGAWKGNISFNNTEWYAGKWTVNEMIVHFEDGDFAVLAKADNSLTQGLKNIKITVTTKPVASDSNFASVKSIRFTKSKMTLPKNAGGEIEVELAVTDKVGVSFAEVTLYDTKNYRYYHGISFLDKSIKSGKMTVRVYVNQYIPTSNLEVYSVTVRNSNYKYKYYHKYYKNYTNTDSSKYVALSSDMKKLKVKVKNTYKK